MNTILDNKLKIEKEKRDERMKNLVKQMFNKNTKESFLKTIDESKGTRESYAVYLVQAASWEENIKKDLYSFNREDVLDICSDNFTSSPTALRIFYSVCKQYAAWAISQGYVETMINPFELVKFKQHILPMLNIKGLLKTIITEEELWKIINGFTNEKGEFIEPCSNAQEKLSVILPMYSVKGEECSELTNLKKQDVNYENNTVTVMNNKGIIRDVELPEKVMRILKQASMETEYITRRRMKSGKIVESINRLYDNDFIFRPRVTNRTDINITEEPTAVLIFSRAKKVMKKAGEEYSKISINDISNSGKIKMLNEIYKEKGKIETDDYKNVQEKFGEDLKNYSNIKMLWEQLSKVE